MRVNLLRAHGSPTLYLYAHADCRCRICKSAQAERDRRYYQGHRDEALAANRRWRAEHPEKDAEYARRFRREHPERAARNVRRYYERHAEQVCAGCRSWRQEHPEKCRSYKRARRAREYNAPGNYTKSDVLAQYDRQRGRCFWCNAKVGEDYHADHVIPLSKGGGNGPENIVVACPRCNQTKNAKHPMDFAGVLL